MSIRSLERTSPAGWFYDVRHQLRDHVYARSERAFDRGERTRDALASAAQVQAYQTTLRSTFIASLGGLPPMDTPLEAHITGTVRCAGYWIEKVIFQSAPARYVTGNLYVPDGLEGPSAGVLFLCGHASNAHMYSEYQAVCQILCMAGMVVFSQDPIGQGERFSYWEPALGYSSVREGTCEHDYSGAQCQAVGDCQARYMLHDAMRSIDYMLTRPEVDGARIGITGNSGGGTQSSMMMLADPRIAAAAPGTFIMDRRTYMYSGGAQDAEQIWRGFSASGYDHEDILIAMAPRPVRVLAVTGDFFPIEGTRRTVERCQRIWGLFDRAGDVDHAEDQSNHAYTCALATASADFFSRHLLGRPAEVDLDRVATLPDRQLWCTQSGQVRADFPDSEGVFEANLARLREAETAREALEPAARRERALDWLSDRVRSNRIACDLNPRMYYTDHVDDLIVDAAVWWAQEGIMGHGFRFRSMADHASDVPATIAIWDGGTTHLQEHYDWIRAECAGGRAVIVLDVTGAGSLEPHNLTDMSHAQEGYGVLHKLADDLRWLDDDLAAMRTWDVLRAVEMAAIWPGCSPEDPRLYCSGRHGLYGRLAAPLDARITGCEVADAPTCVADWVGSRHYNAHDIKTLVIDGMLRYFDLPDIAI